MLGGHIKYQQDAAHPSFTLLGFKSINSFKTFPEEENIASGWALYSHWVA